MRTNKAMFQVALPSKCEHYSIYPSRKKEIAMGIFSIHKSHKNANGGMSEIAKKETISEHTQKHKVFDDYEVRFGTEQTRNPIK